MLFNPNQFDVYFQQMFFAFPSKQKHFHSSIYICDKISFTECRFYEENFHPYHGFRLDHL